MLERDVPLLIVSGPPQRVVHRAPLWLLWCLHDTLFVRNLLLACLVHRRCGSPPCSSVRKIHRSRPKVSFGRLVKKMVVSTASGDHVFFALQKKETQKIWSTCQQRQFFSRPRRTTYRCFVGSWPHLAKPHLAQTAFGQKNPNLARSFS